MMIRKNILAMILGLMVGTAMAQSFTGAEQVCKNTNYAYSYYDDVEYTSVGWSVTGGGTIVSGSGLNRTIKWSGDGTVTATMYYYGSPVSSSTKYVYAYTPGTLAGPSAVCPGGAAYISLSGTYGSSFTYQYSTDGSNWYTIGTYGTGINVYPSTTTYYRAHPGACGWKYNTSNTITVSINPSPTVYSVGGNGGYCSGGSGATVWLSGSQSGASYQLKLNGGNHGSAVGGTGGTLYWYNLTSAGTYTISATLNGCPADMSGSAGVTVYPLATPTITSGPATVCEGSGGHYYYTQSGMSNYNWQISTGGTITGNYGYYITVTWNTPGTNYSRWVRASYTNTYGCPSSDWGYGYTDVIARPTPYFTAGPTAACENTGGHYYEAPNNYNSYNWNISGGTITSGGTGYNYAYVSWGTGSPWISVSYSDAYGCAAASPAYRYVTLNARPVPSFTSGQSSVCEGATGITYATQSGMSNYQWAVPSGGTITAGGGTGHSYVTVTWNTAGARSVTVGYTNGNGCTSYSPTTYNVTVNAPPTVYTVGGGGVYCSGGSGVAITLSGSQTNVNYQLKLNGANQGAPLAGTGGSLNWNNQTGTGNYTVVATSAANCPQNMSGSASVSTDAMSVGGSLSPVESYHYSTTNSGTITLSGYTGAVVRWEQNTGGGWSTIENVMTTTHEYTDLATETTLFRVFVKNGVCNEVASSEAEVNTHPAPVIQVNKESITYGDSATFSVTDTFSEYQWYKNGQQITGATGAIYYAREPATYRVSVRELGYPNMGNSQDKVIASAYLSSDPDHLKNVHSVTRVFKPGITSTTSLFTLKADEVSQTLDYQDGLGRTFQVVGVGQSPGGKDMIQPVGYSQQGLVETSYLPYASDDRTGFPRANAIRGADINESYFTSEQHDFYDDLRTSGAIADSMAYSVKVLSSTPLMRLKEQGAPGVDWQPGNGHTIKNDLLLNTAGEVRKWKPDGTSTETYPANTLVISQVTDENGNKVKTYSDKAGRTILKKVEADGNIEAVGWLETYYVYDQYGRLKYQVPPKAVLSLDGTPDLENDAPLAELIFKYTYDVRGRLVEKKVPGSGVQFVIYDQLDRVVLTQDANQRAENKWMFVKYDIKNRPVYSGIYANSGSRGTVQGLLDALNYDGSDLWYEKEEVNATYHGYSNQAFPTSGTTLLTVNYYDHYDFDRNGSPDYTYDNTHLSGQETTASTRTRGMPTGSKRVIMDVSGVTSDWLVGTTFYDGYDRPIQTHSNNQLYLTVADKQTTVYDFTKPLKSKITHNQSSTKSVTLETRTDYDHVGRVKGLYQAHTEPVNWINPVGVSIAGNTVTKTGSAGWNAGAFSTNHIPAYSNGWVECVANNTTTYRMLGLSENDPNESYASIDFALYMAAGAVLEVYEEGAYKGTFGSYSTNDIMRVERVGNKIHYKKNGSVFYSSTVTSTSRLYADVSLYTESSQITNAVMGIETQISAYNYDELGRLVNKQIHKDETNGWLQQVDLKYTIRGWLSQINDPSSIGSDFFAMKMYYNESLGALSQAGKHNGNITAIEWKEGFGNSITEVNKAFAYNYYKNDQLQKAAYGQGTSFSSKSNAFNEEQITYDANGNIAGLTRKGLSSGGVVNTIDNLTYTYDSNNKNRLAQVEDGSGPLGFNNGQTSTTEFTYDLNGNLNKDENKGIDTVTYNELNKVKQVTFLNGRILKYTYDASGTKLAMDEYDGAALVKSTKYVGGFVYESDTLRFFSSPEGRVVVDNGTYEYQYALTDHQGNTRTVFTSKEETLEFIATFETVASGLRADTDLFENVDANKEKNFGSANHTPNGEKAYEMNQLVPAGPGLMLRVYPGDIVDPEVYAYHENNSGYGTTNTGLSAMITAIAGAFGGANGGGGEAQVIYDAFNDALTAVGLGGNQGDDKPAAYLNYIFFDEVDGYDEITQDDDAGWKAVPASAYYDTALIKFDNPIVIKKPGYIYVYLSYENQSNNFVYFDDLKISYQKSQVVQSNNYYAFGLQTSQSWTRIDTKPNQYLYNSGSELNELTGNYETFFRGYDPSIGRMGGVDIFSDIFSSVTPYNYSLNDPLYWSDPTGSAPEYEWASLGGCGCWRDRGPEDYGGEANGLYASDWFKDGGWSSMADAYFDGLNGAYNPLYESMIYGEASARYGPGDGGALSRLIDPISNRLSLKQFFKGHTRTRVKDVDDIHADGGSAGTLFTELIPGKWSRRTSEVSKNLNYKHSVVLQDDPFQKPGPWDLLSEESFNFQNAGSNWQATRVRGIYFIVVDGETGTRYENFFTLEIGVPKKSKDKVLYSKKDATDFAALVANSVATQTAFVSTFIGPGGRAMTLNSATLPYYFATQMQLKLNNYIPGATVTGNTYLYPVKESRAVYVNFFKGLLERLN